MVDATDGSRAHCIRRPIPIERALIASGWDCQGVTLGVLDNVDVAPTMAELLGLNLPNVDGKVLKEILAPRQ